VINTKAMREKYASNNGRAPAGAVDVRALCDELDLIVGLGDDAGHCDTCIHDLGKALATVCRNCRVIGSKWEAAT
jgi:hypothetical protein